MIVTTRANGSVLWPWVIRAVLALAALAAPIITFHALTESDGPDPERQERLRQARDGSGPPVDPPRRESHTTAQPPVEARP